jgi:hypothetical protein
MAENRGFLVQLAQDVVSASGRLLVYVGDHYTLAWHGEGEHPGSWNGDEIFRKRSQSGKPGAYEHLVPL